MSTVHQHPDYNREKFPVLVCHHGNWDIFRNEAGSCAAIPTETAEKNGCRASHFGGMSYVRQVLARELLEFAAKMAMA